jgi:Wiskott-Aldrich syndrome protein
MDVDKYDEYVPRPEQEVITVETKIKSSNKGFAMLAKLGWVEGQPLGVSGEGNLTSYSPGMAFT